MVPDHNRGPPPQGSCGTCPPSDHLKDTAWPGTRWSSSPDLVLSPLAGEQGGPPSSNRTPLKPRYSTMPGFLRCAGWPWGP